MDKRLLDYFNGDELAANVWRGKYAMDDENDPDDMHKRLAKEFARIEKNYKKATPKQKDLLSDFGRDLNELNLSEEAIYLYFKNFKYIVPQGSVMYGLGRKGSVISLSNCLRLPPPQDSYSSILFTDNQLVNSAKRRCGYGLGLSGLRPRGATVTNSAGTSTGAASFMGRYSNSTREVAQEGRRGACLLDIDVTHPDSMEFAESKIDKTQITGANISIKVYDDFMKSVYSDHDYVLRYPTTIPITDIDLELLPEYNKLYKIDDSYYKKVKAKEYWDRFIELARDNAEPGLFYWDKMINYDPASVYESLRPDGTNACGKLLASHKTFGKFGETFEMVIPSLAA